MSVEKVHETVFVTSLTDGVLDPAKPMLGPVRDGGHMLPTHHRVVGDL